LLLAGEARRRARIWVAAFAIGVAAGVAILVAAAFLVGAR
jgi:hypothetical protein